ncbi:MAG: hypothetical protein FWD17_00620 [Polyangiaceae bacterium]|nr:hypothetical protein [Polyangiaceae bacterium]
MNFGTKLTVAATAFGFCVSGARIGHADCGSNPITSAEVGVEGVAASCSNITVSYSSPDGNYFSPDCYAWLADYPAAAIGDVVFASPANQITNETDCDNTSVAIETWDAFSGWTQCQWNPIDQGLIHPYCQCTSPQLTLPGGFPSVRAAAAAEMYGADIPVRISVQVPDVGACIQ